MTERIVLLGGHGKVARLLIPKLATAGIAVDAVIRKAEQSNEIESLGGKPVVLDIENASIEDFVKLFKGAKAIVFSAGAGGGNPKRTRAVDFEAATRTMEAAEQAGVKRYIMVSYSRASHHYKELDTNDSFFPYAKAKRDADEYLRRTNLDYTILGPGLLTLEPASRHLQIADARGDVEGDWSKTKSITSRDNVAEVIAYLLQHETPVRNTVNFYDGDTPLDQALTAPADDSAEYEVVVQGSAKGFAQEITAGGHPLVADEPVSVGGTNTGPAPYDLLLAALGACTSMTISLYARRKEWPLEDVTVKLHHGKIHAKDCENCETQAGRVDRIECVVELHGPLDDDQRARLLEIAAMCPVHRTLKSEIDIQVRGTSA